MGYPPCAACYPSGCCHNLLCCPSDKKYWPEFAGMNATNVKAEIEAENPDVTAIIINDGTPKPKDFCCNRVLVVARNGIVVQVPQIG